MTETTKRKLTPDQLKQRAAYLREYRAKNPARVRAWRDAYTIRRAAKLQAEAEARGGADCGGN